MDVVDICHTNAGTPRDQKRAWKDLELQEVVRFSVGILGTKLCSSGRAEGTLTQGVAQAGPQLLIFLLLPLQHILLAMDTSSSVSFLRSAGDSRSQTLTGCPGTGLLSSTSIYNLSLTTPIFISSTPDHWPWTSLAKGVLQRSG